MPDEAHEDAREMTLVDEAAFERDVGKGLVTLAKQHHRALDTGPVEPSIGRHASRITECSSKVARRQAARLRDRCERGRASEIGQEHVFRLMFLPSRESALGHAGHGLHPAVGFGHVRRERQVHLVHE
jgi:hypothetical protein